jgi:hypothetical protein
MTGASGGGGAVVWEGGRLARLGAGRRNVARWSATTGQRSQNAEKPAATAPGGLGREDVLDATD